MRREVRRPRYIQQRNPFTNSDPLQDSLQPLTSDLGAGMTLDKETLKDSDLILDNTKLATQPNKTKEGAGGPGTETWREGRQSSGGAIPRELMARYKEIYPEVSNDIIESYRGIRQKKDKLGM